MLKKILLDYALPYGLAGGILCFLYFLGLVTAGYMPLDGKYLISISINALIMAVSVWQFRRKTGFVQLWQALTICHLVNISIFLCSACLLWGYLTYFDHEMLPQYAKTSIAYLEYNSKELSKTIGKESLMLTIAGLREITPTNIAQDEIIKKFLMGVLPSFIISLYFRKTQN